MILINQMSIIGINDLACVQIISIYDLEVRFSDL